MAKENTLRYNILKIYIYLQHYNILQSQINKGRKEYIPEEYL